MNDKPTFTIKLRAALTLTGGETHLVLVIDGDPRPKTQCGSRVHGFARPDAPITCTNCTANPGEPIAAEKRG